MEVGVGGDSGTCRESEGLTIGGNRWRSWRPSLTLQIFIALALGIVLGAVLPGWGHAVKPVGDAFLRLIRMVVVPLVFASLAVGVAELGDIRRVSRVGLKTLIYFSVVTSIAIIAGMIAANLVKPGSGLNLSAAPQTISGAAGASGAPGSSGAAASVLGQEQASAGVGPGFSLTTLLINVIPTNPVEAMAKADMLQIIFFAVVFGLGLTALTRSQEAATVVTGLRGVARATYSMTGLIMKTAPLGVLALIADTVATNGLAVLLHLGLLVLTMYAAAAVFVVVVFGFIAHLAARVRFIPFLRRVSAPVVLAFSTSSSAAAIPESMRRLEEMGASPGVTSFVVPLGTSVNMDGTSLYEALAVLFIAQAYGVDLSLAQQLLILGMLVIVSHGTGAVPSGSLIVLMTVLKTMGLPQEGVALIAGVDRIMDMGRTAVNVIGNNLAALVISRLEGDFHPPEGGHEPEGRQE